MFVWELLDAGGVAINKGSRGDAMDKIAAAKAPVGK
jgi:hypothetical protein